MVCGGRSGRGRGQLARLRLQRGAAADKLARAPPPRAAARLRWLDPHVSFACMRSSMDYPVRHFGAGAVSRDLPVRCTGAANPSLGPSQQDAALVTAYATPEPQVEPVLWVRGRAR